MDASGTKPQPTQFNINELVMLSESANTLQHRLLATSQILKYLALEDQPEEQHQWIINTTNWKVSKSPERISLSEEMLKTLSVFEHCYNENGDELLNVDLDAKRQMVAVIAFMICFRSNPYLGKLFYDKVVISRDWEKDYWGINRIFSFGDDGCNRPDGYYQAETIEFWEALEKTDLTSVLKLYFTDKSKSVADDIPASVYRILSKLKTGGQGSFRMYLSDNITGMPYLLTDKKYLIDSSLNIIGHATQKTENGREDLVLRNLSDSIWEVTTASGKQIDILIGKDMPVRSGMSISIPREGICWSVEGA